MKVKQVSQGAKRVPPYYSCPQFETCSVNHCPVDPKASDREVLPGDPEIDCKAKDWLRLPKCNVCGCPSFVCGPKGKKIPFRPAPDARSFTCGICIANGRHTPRYQRYLEELDVEKNLKAWRKVVGLTQTQLAKQLGVSKAMVCMVEKGEKAMPDKWKGKITALAA